MKRNETVIGECEATHMDGGGQNVQLYQMSHGMMLCESCRDAEINAINQSKQVIQSARQVDVEIVEPEQIMNAGTVAFTEIMAAIERNTEIPADRKPYAVVAEVATRIDHLSRVIFDRENDQTRDKNARTTLQANLQQLVGQMRDKEIQEKYKNYAVNYTPSTPKSKKPSNKLPSSIGPNNRYTAAVRQAVKEACEKYKHPAVNEVSIRTWMLQGNLSAEGAAKKIIEMSK